MQIFQKIRLIVKTVPSGRVTTYAIISKIIKTSPQVVGWALRGNLDSTLPCHRVVKSNGTLASNFSLGNWPEQRRRLEQEGVSFNGQIVRDFKKILFDTFEVK